MSDFAQALNTKITELEENKKNLLSEVSVIDAKLALLKELQEGEGGEVPAAKKRGRPPKGTSKTKKTELPQNYSSSDPDILAEAQQLGGTDPALAERLANRSPRRTALASRSYGPGVHVGSKEAVIGREIKVAPGTTRISIEENDNEPV